MIAAVWFVFLGYTLETQFKEKLSVWPFASHSFIYIFIISLAVR